MSGYPCGVQLVVHRFSYIRFIGACDLQKENAVDFKFAVILSIPSNFAPVLVTLHSVIWHVGISQNIISAPII